MLSSSAPQSMPFSSLVRAQRKHHLNTFLPPPSPNAAPSPSQLISFSATGPRHLYPFQSGIPSDLPIFPFFALIPSPSLTHTNTYSHTNRKPIRRWTPCCPQTSPPKALWMTWPRVPWNSTCLFTTCTWPDKPLLPPSPLPQQHRRGRR